jgi:hypothetical protein
MAVHSTVPWYFFFYVQQLKKLFVFTDCRNAIGEVGTDFILDHFDTLFSVLVHFKQADWSTLSKGWNVIMKGI